MASPSEVEPAGVTGAVTVVSVMSGRFHIFANLFSGIKIMYLKIMYLIDAAPSSGCLYQRLCCKKVTPDVFRHHKSNFDLVVHFLASKPKYFVNIDCFSIGRGANKNCACDWRQLTEPNSSFTNTKTQQAGEKN